MACGFYKATIHSYCEFLYFSIYRDRLCFREYYDSPHFRVGWCKELMWMGLLSCIDCLEGSTFRSFNFFKVKSFRQEAFRPFYFFKVTSFRTGTFLKEGLLAAFSGVFAVGFYFHTHTQLRYFFKMILFPMLLPLLTNLS